MKSFRFRNIRISRKIGGSFALLVLLILFNAAFTLYTLNQGVSHANTLEEEVYPTHKVLSDFLTMVKDSKTQVTNWVYIQNYVEDKERLQAIHEQGWMKLKARLNEVLASQSDTLLQMQVDSSVNRFEVALGVQQEVMQILDVPEKYEDPLAFFSAEDLIENSVIPETEILVANLDARLSLLREYSGNISEKMVADFAVLKMRLLAMAALSFLVAGSISIFLSRDLIRPLSALQTKVNALKRGKIVEKLALIRSDELGEMALDVNSLIDRFSMYTDFSKEIGEGNLAAFLEVKGEDDILGNALQKMRDNLRQIIDDINQSVAFAVEGGKLIVEVSGEDKKGAWAELTFSINQLLQSLSQPLVEIKRLVHHLSEGDLTEVYQLEAKGDVEELVESLDNAILTLRGLVVEIAESAKIIDGASDQMLGASQEMSVNTSEIAVSIAQMSRGAQEQVLKIEASSELAENVMQSSEGVKQKAETINSVAEKGAESSDHGAQVIQIVSGGMEEITVASDKTLQTMQILEQRSEQISLVIKVITEIGSQTNLLALNAAIEAAQAGDAGRGFAVVAEEVRKLAESSNNSAREIGKLINDVQLDTRQALSAIEQTAKLIGECAESTKEANNTFREILASNESILLASREILEAATNQQVDVKKIVSLTENVVIIAEQTAAGAEEVATSSTELATGMENYTEKSQRLKEIATQLQGSVGKFKVEKVEVHE